MKSEQELVIESLERNVENLEEELDMYERKVSHHERLADGLEREIQLKMNILNYFDSWEKLKRKDPKFAFEEDEEYLKLDLESQRIRIESDIFQLQSKKHDAELMIKTALKEIDRIEKALPEAREKLAEARGE